MEELEVLDPPKRKRGRPKGSKNKPKPAPQSAVLAAPSFAEDGSYATLCPAVEPPASPTEPQVVSEALSGLPEEELPSRDEILKAIYCFELADRWRGTPAFSEPLHNLIFPPELLDHYRVIYERFGQEGRYRTTALRLMEEAAKKVGI